MRSCTMRGVLDTRPEHRAVERNAARKVGYREYDVIEAEDVHAAELYTSERPPSGVAEWAFVVRI